MNTGTHIQMNLTIWWIFWGFAYSSTVINARDQHGWCFCSHSWTQAEWPKFESPNGYIPSCEQTKWHSTFCPSSLCVNKCPFYGLFRACLGHFCAPYYWLHCWKWPQAQRWRAVGTSEARAGQRALQRCIRYFLNELHLFFDNAIQAHNAHECLILTPVSPTSLQISFLHSFLFV